MTIELLGFSEKLADQLKDHIVNQLSLTLCPEVASAKVRILSSENVQYAHFRVLADFPFNHHEEYELGLNVLKSLKQLVNQNTPILLFGFKESHLIGD
jgi:hypothetical protein